VRRARSSAHQRPLSGRSAESGRGLPPLTTALIFNPSAGKGRGETTASAAQQELRTRGLLAELHPTQSPQHAVALARDLSARCDAIVAIGGDGTINEVANGMAEAADAAAASGLPAHNCRLGIIPAGTVNVLALELKLPFRLQQACAVIAAGKTLPLDLGKVNNRRFTLMIGAGIDALTIRNVDLRAKRLSAELAFVATGLTKGLAERPPEFAVTVNGTTHRATFFVAGNCRYYAAHLAMTPDADPTDGLLDILLFHGTTRSSMLAFWMGIPSALHLRGENVTCLRSTRAELAPLEGSEPVWFQTDGEVVGELPAAVEIEPGAVEVLVP
jgi:diacylglycerol kinase (ATP)